MTVYIKDSGVIKQPGNIYVRASTVASTIPPSIYSDTHWRLVKRAYIKNNGQWLLLFPSTGNNTYTASASSNSFTVPAGVYSLTVSATGAAGGNGGNDSRPGSSGFPGHIVSGTISVAPGDVLGIYPGRAGSGGASYIAGYGGGSGGYSAVGYGGGTGGAAGNSGVSGGGGGGGAATVIKNNGTAVVVAAGGGGGGGGGNGSEGRGQSGGLNGSEHNGANGIDHGEDGGGSGAGGGGYPGGAGGAKVGGDNGGYAGSDGADLAPTGCSIGYANNTQSLWYATGNEAPGAWGGFIASYGIWQGDSYSAGPYTYSTTLDFPTSGNYTFYFSVDNDGTFSVDGSVILSGNSNFGTYASTTLSVTAGIHQISIYGVNYGGPAAIAGRILNPNGSELWNTLYAVTAGGNGLVTISWS